MIKIYLGYQQNKLLSSTKSVGKVEPKLLRKVHIFKRLTMK